MCIRDRFGMSDDNILYAEVKQHIRRNLARERAGIVIIEVLRAEAASRAFQRLGRRREIRRRRAYHYVRFRIRHKGL